MNQILITKFEQQHKKLKQFKVLFFISVIAIAIFIAIYVSYKIQLRNEKIFSENIRKNYTIYKLFAESDGHQELHEDNDIIGNIIIPKLNINYPFFYGINENLLKIAPCRFWGDMPGNKTTNLCIAGHNYNDDSFFSKIGDLENNDLIIIENNKKKKYYYFVYNKFEIDENEINTITKSFKYFNELTLLTCNNKNNKRIVIKAKTESL